MRLREAIPGASYWVKEAGGNMDDPNSHYTAEVLWVSQDGQHGVGHYARVKILDTGEEITLFEAPSYQMFLLYPIGAFN